MSVKVHVTSAKYFMEVLEAGMVKLRRFIHFNAQSNMAMKVTRTPAHLDTTLKHLSYTANHNTQSGCYNKAVRTSKHLPKIY